jgi:branched-chain amino acid transport system ATP-binding protein
MMLEVENLNVHYGAIQALKGISFGLQEGEIVALIGANGAGKSTTLNTISRLVNISAGDIRYHGKSIANTPPEKIVIQGIVQVPEGRRIFPKMSVVENLEMGAYIHNDRTQIEADMEEMFDKFPRLKERRKQLGGTLSGGEQQMLAIARGLMSHPKLLLLDEPSMGLAPIIVEQIFDIVRQVNQNGVSILLVEQNAQMALAVANRGYVFETGRIVLEGDANDLMENPQVQEAYLGGRQE